MSLYQAQRAPVARFAASPLACRLEQCREEIEDATLARVYAVADPGEIEDPSYAIGLREAVSAALDYVTEALESAPGRSPAAVPERLLAQARSAARSGVDLGTVLRRYSAGYSLLGDFLFAEAEGGEISPRELKLAHHVVSGVFRQVMKEVSDAHQSQVRCQLHTPEQRRTDQVLGLLAGEAVDASELGYELDGWHLGAVAAGPEAPAALRGLGDALGCRLLIARMGPGTLWAWLGSRDRRASYEALGWAEAAWPKNGTLVVGEPGEGAAGWRLSHRQARAALPIAMQGPAKVLRYVDVALLAAALSDDVLAGVLRSAYLGPLQAARDGHLLRETLAAYFTAGRQVTSAASALGISRQTVSVRLRSVEQRVGRPLDSCAAELETALRLDELGGGGNLRQQLLDARQLV